MSQQPGTHIPAAALPTISLQPQPFLRVQTPTPLFAFYSTAWCLARQPIVRLGLTRHPYSQLMPALHQSKEPPVPIYMNVSACISVWVSPGIDFLFPVCSHMLEVFDVTTMALLGMHHSSKELSSGICHVEHVNACNIPNIPSPCLSKLSVCITWY